MVLMSAWMPAPPPESDPAITRTRGILFRPTASSLEARELCIQFLDGGDDVLHHFAHQAFVLALAHHADDGLGAGLAYQDAAATIEPLLPRLDARCHAGV